MALTMKQQAAETPIVIAAYDAAWPATYEAERRRIQRAIGEWLLQIEHVGSTSVPGLAAKPIIDIMPGLRSLADAPHIVPAMQSLGYQYVSEYEAQIPERRYFVRPGGEENRGRHLFHVHAVETTSEFWRRHLAFRDWLRAHPEDCRAYAELKQHLAVQHGCDRDGYTSAKTDFIRGIERRALGESA
jgi:GrpB-like predicted nucleotidyltransferase (UPF0157 family)